MCLSCRVAWWGGHMRELCVACVLCARGATPHPGVSVCPRPRRVNRDRARVCVWRESESARVWIRLAIVVYLGSAKVL